MSLATFPSSAPKAVSLHCIPSQEKCPWWKSSIPLSFPISQFSKEQVWADSSLRKEWQTQTMREPSHLFCTLPPQGPFNMYKEKTEWASSPEKVTDTVLNFFKWLESNQAESRATVSPLISGCVSVLRFVLKKKKASPTSLSSWRRGDRGQWKWHLSTSSN